MQFHWWDYSVPGCVEAGLWLEELRREGKIHLIGGTNFDTPHTEALVAAGVPLASMQVQYSLLDARAENALVDACRRHDIHLLVYGTVAGGFVSDAWLGRPEPKPPFENRSLTKYKLVIDDFGGWALFQELLRALRRIADRHGTDIATVASRAMLDRPRVAAVIVGARNRAHLTANVAISECPFSDADKAEIAQVLARRKGPEGDTFTLERDRTGPAWVDHEVQPQQAGRMSTSTLAEHARQEVVELHDFFVAWLRGRGARRRFLARGSFNRPRLPHDLAGRKDRGKRRSARMDQGRARKPPEPLHYRGAGPSHNLGGRGRGLAGIHRATVS